MSSTYSDEDLPLNNLLKRTNSVSAKTKSITDPSAKDSPVKYNNPGNIPLVVVQEKKKKKTMTTNTDKKKTCPVVLDNPDLYDNKNKTKENQEDGAAENEEGDTETEDKMDNTNKEEYEEESDKGSDHLKPFQTLLRSHGYLSSEDNFLSKKDDE